MHILKWDSLIKSKEKQLFNKIFKDFLGTALTIGGFDGPHKGHALLFDKVIKKSKVLNLVPGVITFIRPPKVLAANEVYLGDVTSLPLRLNKMREKGFQFVVLIDFSKNFSTIAGDTFIDFLVNTIYMKSLTVGKDFRCGYRLDTGIAEIAAMSKKKGFCFDSIDQIEIDGLRISSSAVRQAVLSADFAQAKKFLGYPYLLDLSENSWVKTDSFLKTRKKTIFQVLPPMGKYHALIYTGTGNSVTVEVHITQEFVIIYTDAEIDSLVFQTIKTLEFINIKDLEIKE